MAKKKSAEDSGPNNAYLVSFGDTMTTLLAFFIVLNSLAEEQTGANLHAGTGSFFHAISSFGMPGVFGGNTAPKPVPRDEESPMYLPETPEGKDPARNPTGPDSEPNDQRVIDREAEQFQRFMNEIERFSKVTEVPKEKGEVIFDFFTPINTAPPLLPPKYHRELAPVYPLLSRPGYQVDITVWATTPSDSAWNRATQEANSIAKEIIKKRNLGDKARSRLRSFGQPWIHQRAKRPVFSVSVRKLETS